LKIHVDRELCEGNAVCEALAPAVFGLGAGDQAQVLTGDAGAVDDAYRELVERAAAGCPRLAITVTG
jgi:ferredoxin